MNLCGTIWRTHFGSPQFPGTLASITVVLRRKYLQKEKPQFHSASELLQIVFDAMVQLLCEALQSGGMTDEQDIPSAATIITNSFLHMPSPSLFGLPSTTANNNALLFLRDVAMYIELGEAIKAGDIGHIKHLLLFITLMMHGGGNMNYSLELLHLLYGIHYLWTDEWTRRVLSSMLVNPKGGAGGWMASDMLQENHNYLIKTIFAANGSNMSWEYLQDAISTNIKTFQNVARWFEQDVGVSTSSTKHKTSSITLDVDRIKKHLQDGGFL